MQHAEHIALASIFAAYAGFEFLVKDLFLRKTTADEKSVRDRVKAGGVLFTVLIVSTIAMRRI